MCCQDEKPYCGNCEHFFELERFDELFKEYYTGFCGIKNEVIKVDSEICEKHNFNKI